mmetsp:Transcript_8445/g.15904  ORF Transcript_8445/g.15904 Transcript_8445/m.15904 type:complete len:187 (-) Transcript_8445:211-771(-)
MAQTVFYIGTRQVSKPYTQGVEQWPPVDMVVMKPCVCGDFNVLHADSQIPHESLSATRLTEEEVRDVMTEVSESLNRSTRCCWGWGWCCCFMFLIWWLDMCFQQCRCGLTKCCCQNRAMTKIEKILEKHNQTLKGKGVSLRVISAELDVTTRSQNQLASDIPLLMVEQTNTVHFDTWLVEVYHGTP